MSPNTERLTPMELRFPGVSGDEPYSFMLIR